MDQGIARHQPLYLKYRPQSLERLIGQPAVTRTLTNAIKHTRLTHAYLFTGPRGTGKTSTARILARSLNCEAGPTVAPCDRCPPCQEIKTGSSPAVFEIDAASNNSVDDARLLIERAPLVAVGGRYKLYIIDECHMLTREAFNALLKTLEEPPPNVVFVLATTEEHKVPATIVSRCQRLMFRLVNEDELVGYLADIAAAENIEMEEEALKLVARRSGGGLRDALGLLEQASLLAEAGRRIQVNDLLALLGAVHEDVLLKISLAVQERQGLDALEAINELLTEGREPAVLAAELARHFLNLAKASYVGGAEPPDPSALSALVIGSPQYRQALVEQARHFERAELAQMVEQLNRLEQSCRRTTQPAMHLEMGLLALCHRHDIVVVRELDMRVRALESGAADMPAGRSTEAAVHRQWQPAHPDTQPAAASLAGAAQALAGGIKVVKDVVEATHQAWHEASDALAGSEGDEPAPDEPVRDGEIAGERSIAQRQAAVPPVAEQLEAAGEAVTLQTAPSGGQGEDEPAAMPPAAEGSEAEACAGAGAEDVDEFWSQLLDELDQAPQVKAILTSSYPFPLRLDGKDFTIGVPNDMWKKNVERRLEPIRTAAERVLARQVSVHVKIVAEAPGRPASRPRASHIAQPHRASGSSRDLPDESGDPEPASGLSSLPGDDAETRRTPPLPTASPSPYPAGNGGDNDRGAPQIVSARVASQALSNAVPAGSNGTMVKEAYKLFEGPGSRLIG